MRLVLQVEAHDVPAVAQHVEQVVPGLLHRIKRIRLVVPQFGDEAVEERSGVV